ncbi:uncharacterized protein LOC121982764 [Zingiber officinale]|uniref:uncharacterized protein LOC121982764 n=1 Tax=Zingiber officinale TaxID=94328 RepID=UPI001C4D11E7|nr:uncharacterized protein LOC121982764 [Zingiber officinale]
MEGTVALERKSSIELEPRTLSFGEFQLARDSALYIFKNNSLEEAIKIFTEGLQSVPKVGDDGRLHGIDDVDSVEEESEEDDYCFRRWMGHGQLLGREIATAPF